MEKLGDVMDEPLMEEKMGPLWTSVMLLPVQHWEPSHSGCRLHPPPNHWRTVSQFTDCKPLDDTQAPSRRHRVPAGGLFRLTDILKEHDRTSTKGFHADHHRPGQEKLAGFAAQADDADVLVLRVAIVGRGANGFQYDLQLVSNGYTRDDVTCEVDDVVVSIAAKSAVHMDGATLDFKESLMVEDPTLTTPTHCGQTPPKRPSQRSSRAR